MFLIHTICKPGRVRAQHVYSYSSFCPHAFTTIACAAILFAFFPLHSSSNRGISTNPIQEAQTFSPITTPPEHHTPIAWPTRRPTSYFPHKYGSSAGMTNDGPSHAQVVVACMAPERYAGLDNVQNPSAAGAAHVKLHLWPRFETSTNAWPARTWITKLWWRVKTCWLYRRMSWSANRRDAVVRISWRVRDAQRVPRRWG
jgi:hypothetical protein